MNTMKWYDWMHYGILLLMAVAVPVAWRYALWVALTMVTVTLVKMVAQRRVGNPALTPALRVALCAPVAYWLVLALSLLWTSDTATGLALLYLKAVLLIFPASFLLTDTTYLTRGLLRGVGYALLAGVVAAFLYFLASAAVEMFKGVEFNAFKNSFYSSERVGVYHHAYIALYSVVAMLFVYHELSSYWKELKWWLRVLLVVSLLMIICHTVIVNSRAGMLAMGLTAVVCVAHLVVTQRSWKLGLVVGLLVAASFVAATKLLPGYVDRLGSTVENVQDDARTHINRCNWHAVLRSPLVGHGAGDYHAVQVEQYGLDEYSAGTSAEFNAHNQYMESLLAAGILGLLALLLFLLAPLALAWRGHSRYLFPVAVATGVVMLNLLFESMLERQMGLLFIGTLYPVMVLIMSLEKNKFVRMKKS